MLPKGGAGWTFCPATERFLRYDPARNSVDYIAHVAEFPPGWSLEGAVVSEDFAGELSDSWPAVIIQYLIDAYPELDVYPLSMEQAQEMSWQPYFEDEHPPSFDHLWRPANVSVGWLECDDPGGLSRRLACSQGRASRLSWLTHACRTMTLG